MTIREAIKRIREVAEGIGNRHTEEELYGIANQLEQRALEIEHEADKLERDAMRRTMPEVYK